MKKALWERKGRPYGDEREMQKIFFAVLKWGQLPCLEELQAFFSASSWDPTCLKSMKIFNVRFIGKFEFKKIR